MRKTRKEETSMKKLIEKFDTKINEIIDKNKSRHDDWDLKMIKARNPKDGGKIDGFTEGKGIVEEFAERQTEVYKKGREKMVDNAMEKHLKSGAFSVIEEMKGETSYSIAKRLNSLNIPTGKGKQWKPNQVDRIKEYHKRIDPAELPPAPKPATPTMGTEEISKEDEELIEKLSKHPDLERIITLAKARRKNQ